MHPTTAIAAARFPTVAAYDGADETHWAFMVATTHLFGAMLGVHAAKVSDDVAHKDLVS